MFLTNPISIYRGIKNKKKSKKQWEISSGWKGYDLELILRLAWLVLFNQEKIKEDFWSHGQENTYYVIFHSILRVISHLNVIFIKK